jgi:arylsulfatase A-like enzyme
MKMFAVSARAVRGVACSTVFVVLCGAPLFAGSRVVLISVDGLRPDAITAETAPNMSALKDRGTTATSAYNDLPSATLTNHATMLTGLSADVHGLLLDFALPGTIPQKTIFDYAAEAGLRTAFSATKTKFTFLAHAESIDTLDIDGDTAGVVDRFFSLLKSDQPDLAFIHIRNPDSAGHAHGWMSPEYLDAVALTDSYIGRILEAIDSGLDEDTYLILTADHGGEGPNHFLNTELDRHIPWIITGPTIAAGATLDTEIFVADTAPTILWLLGVDAPANLTSRTLTELGGDAATVDSGLSIPIVGIPCILFSAPLLCMLAASAIRARRRM